MSGIDMGTCAYYLHGCGMPRRPGIRDLSGVKTISQPWPLLLHVEKNSNLDGGKFGGENVDF
jgi:hypothetical protein